MLPLYCYPLCFGIPYYIGARGVSGFSTYHLPYHFIRQYPDVDPTMFEQSAKSMQTLMQDASIVLQKLAQSKDFASKVMSAAQHSNMKEVDQLIKSTGIKSKVKTSFNPDGIHMELSSSIGQAECCHLTVSLRWI